MGTTVPRRIKVKSYTRKELANLYEISVYKFKKRLRAMLKDPAVKEKFGEYDHTFTVKQVRMIFKHQELPFDIDMKEESFED